MEDNDTFRPSEDQSDSVHGHRNGESAWKHVKNKIPSDKNKNTWQREKCTRRKAASARNKKKINHQCNVTFGSTVVN